MTRKMERKYRDEGWHNPSDAPPIDYPVVYLLLPFASVAFLVALMKGPSVIVLISLFRFHLSLSSSFSLSFLPIPLPLIKRYRYERVNRIGRRTGARIPAQTFAHASNPLARSPSRINEVAARAPAQTLYIVCHNDIVFYRF